MSEILLQTKLLVPQTRPLLVPRPRLLEKMTAGMNGRLTLISAPAGYGKTTLVASWLATQPKLGVAWYSLDEYDNDLARFLRYFLAAWQTISPENGRSAQGLLHANPVGTLPQPPEAIMTMLINDLVASSEQQVVVIDDVHLIEDKTIRQALAFWLDHSPPTIHTILISRTEPQLPLSRLRVRGQLNDISHQDLQFSTHEAADFLREVMQLDLSAEQISLLVARTEGWIASLQLAALSLQGTDDAHELITHFSGSDRQMMDYLLEEVWQRQPEAIQQFLLQTSVPSRFNAPLCDALSGQTDSQSHLIELDRKNLFLRQLDHQQNWYCYHPIFANFLQTRLRHSDLVHYRQLHRDASQWFAAHDLPEEAIDHALAGEAYDQAAHLILAEVNNLMWRENRPQTLLRWCRQLPNEVFSRLPELAPVYAWSFVMVGEFAEMASFLDEVEMAWQRHETAVSSTIQGEIATLRGELALIEGRIADSLAWFTQADVLVPLEEERIRAASRQAQGYAYRLNGDLEPAKTSLIEARRLARTIDDKALWFFASFDYAVALLMAGQLDDSERIQRQVIESVPEAQRPSLTTLNLSYSGVGEILLYRNQLPSAHEYAEEGLRLSRISSNKSPMARYALLVLAQVEQAQGAWPASRNLLKEAMSIAQKSGNERMKAHTAMWAAQLYLLQGEPEPMRAWLEERLSLSSAPDSIPVYHYQQEQVVLGRFLLLDENPGVIAHLERCRETAVSSGWRHLLLEIDILLALAHQARRQMDGAFTYLQSALSFAAEKDFVYPFTREGAGMTKLLRLALAQGLMPDTVGKLQAAFMPTAVSTQPLLDPLTNRELEVLAFIADGLTNPEIAERMFLATGTVAKYTNNIFSKLAVRNRTEAANRAQSLGLIETDSPD